MSSPDDGYDFPPVEHPVRETITIALTFITVLSVFVWLIYKLICRGI